MDKMCTMACEPTEPKLTRIMAIHEQLHALGSEVFELQRDVNSKRVAYYAIKAKDCEEEKPSYRPFNDTELEQLIGKIVKRRAGETKSTITGIFSYCWLYLPGVGKISPAKLFDDYVFLDGSPCGVEVKQIGNSVCPKIAESLVGAGLAK